jgi:hypothetical protein
MLEFTPNRELRIPLIRSADQTLHMKTSNRSICCPLALTLANMEENGHRILIVAVGILFYIPLIMETSRDS